MSIGPKWVLIAVFSASDNGDSYRNEKLYKDWIR